MSAANRGAIRQEADFYRTDEKYTQLIINEIRPEKLIQAAFMEPCKGDSAILNMFAPLVRACEWAEIREGRDYLGMMWANPTREIVFDLSVSNPPYSLAQQFVTKNLREAETVIYLLRLNFWGSQERREWWRGREPTHQFTLAERPAFVDVCKGVAATKSRARVKGCGRAYPLGTGGKCECGGTVAKGTDATEYAWFGWDRAGFFKRPPGMYVL